MTPRRGTGQRAGARMGQNRGRGRNERGNDRVDHRGERLENRTGRRDEEVHSQGNQHPLGPLMTEFVAALAAHNLLAHPPRADSSNRALEAAREFHRLNPPKFDGLDSDPLIAHHWLAEVRKIFNALSINEDNLRVHLVALQLIGEANQWWQSVLEERKDARRAMRVTHQIDEPDVENITWAEFEAKFEDQYFPRSYRQQLRRQFEKLEQGTLTVSEYVIKFQTLSRFAPEFVRTEEDKCRRFLGGLNHSIRRIIVGVGNKKYTDIVEAARNLENEDVEYENEQRSEGQLPNPNVSATPRAEDSQNRKRARESFQPVYSYAVSRTPPSGFEKPYSSSSVLCHRCGQPGHFRAQCPKPKPLPRQRVPNSGICFGCGEFGHFEKSCPYVSGSHQPGSSQDRSHHH